MKSTKSKILGISSYYHDSAAALIEDGEIIAASHEERFTRKKNDSSFPVNSIRYCLDYRGIELMDLEGIVFYEKPLLKFERLLETYLDNAPDGVQQFVKSIPIWLSEKAYMKEMILFELNKIQKINKNNIKVYFSNHHLSHAASAFFPSPFENAAILTIDGVGEWATASISHGKGNSLIVLKEMLFPHSLGLLYSAFTYYLGFKVNSGEYKLMGLSPYGNRNSKDLARFIELIKKNLVRFYEDGSLILNLEYFDYQTGLKMIREEKWEKLFGFPVRKPESPLSQEHCDMALAIQFITNEAVEKMARTSMKITGSRNLCMAGGVALNCVSNGKLERENIFDGIWIQPSPGDAGGALGAALAFYHIGLNRERKIHVGLDGMKGAFLGPEFSDLDVQKLIRETEAIGTFYKSFDRLTEDVATQISRGNVVGWFQGRMEWGPRSLGNRSILGDARNPEMQKKLNLKIKFREGFRPFAPAVLYEDVKEFFETEKASPYMLFVHNIAKNQRNSLPEEYDQFSIADKLYFIRSTIPAVTHIDFSARIQTVHRETNPEFWALLNKFKNLTGCPVLVNTSFNVRGEPIVCNPYDAYKCFMRTNMDFLVINNYLFDKTKQPQWEEKKDWKEEYGLD